MRNLALSTFFASIVVLIASSPALADCVTATKEDNHWRLQNHCDHSVMVTYKRTDGEVFSIYSPIAPNNSGVVMDDIVDFRYCEARSFQSGACQF